MTDPSSVDVFISHSSKDAREVDHIARRLMDEEGIAVWVDRWHLVPGQPWQEGIEAALDRASSCAVFIGSAGITPWENEELRSALQLRADRPDFRVVPVLLPGATLPERGTLPRFLSRLTWVDFRTSEGIADSEAFRRLVAGIRGTPPGPPHVGRRQEDVCPYRGLEPFDEEHARFFLGRDALTQHLVEAVLSSSFVTILGASGSGKSSLARAGLLPVLRRHPSMAGARFVVLKPGAHPLQELAVSLSADDADGDKVEHAHSLLATLENDERALFLYGRLLQQDGRSLFLLIDQFEEIFTLCVDAGERNQFVRVLRYAATVPNGPVRSAITLRADFLPKTAHFTELAELVSYRPFVVSPMDGEDLRVAIAQPAAEVGLRLENGLVDRILTDTGNEPGALPLLEHTLLQLWQRRRLDGTLTLQAYAAVNGVSGALASHAEEVFGTLPADAQALVRRVLLRLTQPGEGTEDTRRRAAMTELWGRAEERQTVEAVVTTLANAHLLTTGLAASGERQVDVAHEALIRGWPRLRAWIDDDRASLRVQRLLTAAANEWHERGEDESVLFRGARLAEAEEWSARRLPDLSELERRFIDASCEARDREERQRQRRQERELKQAVALAEEQQRRAEAERKRAEEQATSARRLKSRFRVSVGLAFIAVVAAIGFTRAYRNASRARVTAENRRLVVESLALRDEQFDLSLLLAVQAYRRSGNIDAEGNLLRMLLHEPSLESYLQAHDSSIHALAFDAAGTSLLTGSVDGSVRFWDVQTGTPARDPIDTGLGSVEAVAWAGDAGRLAVIGDSSIIQSWDVQSGRMLFDTTLSQGRPTLAAAFSDDGTLAAIGNRFRFSVWDVAAWRPVISDVFNDVAIVSGLDFSPDGSELVTADIRQPVRVWAVSTGDSVGPRLQPAADDALGVAFSPDGRRIASSTVWVSVWDRDRPGELEYQFAGHLGNVRAVEFSPDGNLIASGGDDATVRLWDLRPAESLDRVLRGHRAAVTTLTFSPDGDRIAAADGSGAVIFWHVEPRHRLETRLDAHDGSVSAVAFDPGGDRLVSGGAHGQIRFWDARTGDPLGPPLEALDDDVYNLRYSPDGRRLAVLGMDAIHIWDTEVDRVVTRMIHRGDRPTHLPGAAFSPDGEIFASGGTDRVIRLWNVETGDSLHVLEGHEATPLSLGFSPDGATLVSGGGDGTIRFWDPVTGRSDGQQADAGAAVYLVEFTPDGSRLISVSETGITIWNARSRTPITEFRIGNLSRVAAAAVLPERRIVTLDADGLIRFFDLDAGAQVPEPIQPTNILYGISWPAWGGLAVSPDGARLAVAAVGSQARILDVDPESWIAKACRVANRDLSVDEWRRYIGSDIPFEPTCPAR